MRDSIERTLVHAAAIVALRRAVNRGAPSSFEVRGSLARTILREDAGPLQGLDRAAIVEHLESLQELPGIVRVEVPRFQEPGEPYDPRPLVYFSLLEGARSPEYCGAAFHRAIVLEREAASC